MKIATWNLQRLDKRKDREIREQITTVDADIFILTETNSRITLPGYHFVQGNPLPRHYDDIIYKDGENRTTIWSRYPIAATHQTFDPYTSVCADIMTPLGMLTVYGTIIGIFANRQPRFDNDMNSALNDLDKLSGRHLCFAGDLNTTFSGYVYPSHKAREKLNTGFEKHHLMNITAAIADNVDHIVLSTDFIQDRSPNLEIWNADKSLSDHIGVCVLI